DGEKLTGGAWVPIEHSQAARAPVPWACPALRSLTLPTARGVHYHKRPVPGRPQPLRPSPLPINRSIRDERIAGRVSVGVRVTAKAEDLRTGRTRLPCELSVAFN